MPTNVFDFLLQELGSPKTTVEGPTVVMTLTQVTRPWTSWHPEMIRTLTTRWVKILIREDSARLLREAQRLLLFHASSPSPKKLCSLTRVRRHKAEVRFFLCFFYPVASSNTKEEYIPPDTSRSISERPWMLYGSDVDDFCSSPPHLLAGEGSSEELSSDCDLPKSSTSAMKRICFPHHPNRSNGLEDEEEEDEEDEELSPSAVEVNSKRLRPNLTNVKESSTKTTTTKRRVSTPPGSSSGQGSSSTSCSAKVDVRMIDFANTTFRTRGGSSSTGTVHHGPDCGFLTGLDSLHRLLLEVLSED